MPTYNNVLYHHFLYIIEPYMISSFLRESFLSANEGQIYPENNKSAGKECLIYTELAFVTSFPPFRLL